MHLAKVYVNFRLQLYIKGRGKKEHNNFNLSGINRKSGSVAALLAANSPALPACFSPPATACGQDLVTAT